MSESTSRTSEQAAVATEFCNQYGLTPDQISFNGDSDEPRFDFEAMGLLALELGNFQDISIYPEEMQSGQKLATCRCVITLSNGQTRSTFAVCFIGESLDGGRVVEDLTTAISTARTRVQRQALRMVGFDPVRAHRQRKNGQPITLTEPLNQRALKRKEIHSLAVEMGYIVGGNRQAYEDLLALYYQRRRSTNELSDAEIVQFAAILRGLAQARERRMAA